MKIQDNKYWAFICCLSSVFSVMFQCKYDNGKLTLGQCILAGLNLLAVRGPYNLAVCTVAVCARAFYNLLTYHLDDILYCIFV